MRKLTDKQRLFIKEYLIDKNATAAAIRAGYSKKAATQIGAENRRKPYIKEIIDKAIEELEWKAEVTAERVLREIALIAFSDHKNYTLIGEDGQLLFKTFEEMPEHASRAIKEISEDRIIRENPDGTQIIVHDKIKYKLHSKLPALKLLFDHLGLSAEDIIRLQLDGKDGQPIEFIIKYVNTNGAGAEDDDKED